MKKLSKEEQKAMFSHFNLSELKQIIDPIDEVRIRIAELERKELNRNRQNRKKGKRPCL